MSDMYFAKTEINEDAVQELNLEIPFSLHRSTLPRLTLRMHVLWLTQIESWLNGGTQIGTWLEHTLVLFLKTICPKGAAERKTMYISQCRTIRNVLTRLAGVLQRSPKGTSEYLLERLIYLYVYIYTETISYLLARNTPPVVTHPIPRAWGMWTLGLGWVGTFEDIYIYI